jgi:hypothetical protein
MLALAQEYLDRHEGDVVAAMLAFALDLMRGDVREQKAGYSAASAAVTTAEAFEGVVDPLFHAVVDYSRHLDRLLSIVEDYDNDVERRGATRGA